MGLLASHEHNQRHVVLQQQNLNDGAIFMSRSGLCETQRRTFELLRTPGCVRVTEADVVKGIQTPVPVAVSIWLASAKGIAEADVIEDV